MHHVVMCSPCTLTSSETTGHRGPKSNGMKIHLIESGKHHTAHDWNERQVPVTRMPLALCYCALKKL